MTVTHYGNQYYKGLSTDTKPTAAQTAVDAIFEETNTGNQYKNNGTAWVAYGGGGGGAAAAGKGPYKYICYIEGGRGYCQDRDGVVVSDSATLEVPLQYSLDNGIQSKIFWANGNWNVSAGFTGLAFTQTGTRVEADPGCKIRVPSGYTGKVIKMDAGATGLSLCDFSGGHIEEVASQSNLFTGIYLHGTDIVSGVNSCTIGLVGRTYIRHALNALHLHTQGTTPGNGWVNNCTIQNLFCDRFVNGILFQKDVGSFGINRNVFQNVALQSSASAPATLWGVKNVAGNGNEFHNTHIYDLQAGEIYTTITSDASDTLIVGGRMTSINPVVYKDSGRNTVVLADAWTRNRNPHVQSMPSAQLIGTLQGQGLNGTGMFADLTTVGTQTKTTTYNDGMFLRYNSGAVNLDNGGFRVNSTAFQTYRGWNPRMKFKYRFVTVGNCRHWVGWFGTSNELTGDDASNALQCFAIGSRSTDTELMVIHNDNVGVTNYTALTGVAKDTTIRTVELIADDFNNRWGVAIDGGTITWFTTEIPTQQQGLLPHFHVELVTGAVAKSIDRFFMEVRSTIGPDL